MAKTIVGLYDDLQIAHQVVRELENNGFRRDDIGLMASDMRGEYSRYLGDRPSEMKADEVGENAAAGAGIGAVMGGIGGLVVGLGLLTIPGIGPVLAAGPLATALAGAGIGAAAGGLIGALTGLGVPEEQAHMYAEGVRRGGVLVTVKSEDHMADRAAQIMDRFNPIDLDRRTADWRQENWRGFDASSRPFTTDEYERERTRYSQEMRERGETTIPIVEEELRVGKRAKEQGGVRIHTSVSETPMEETVNLRHEEVEVERRPVDRPASESDFDFREETIEVPTVSEEAVVDKQARVTEEVTIRKDVEERPETIRDSVRRTEVHTEDMGTGRTEGFETFETYEPDFRTHWTSTFQNTGYTYDQYRPAYRYGYEMRTAGRYKGRDWRQVESDLRRDWERSHPDNAWDDFKMAVRQGWESIRNR